VAEVVSPWEAFTAKLAEARRAASEGRSADLMTLAAQLGRAAAQLPPPAADQLPAIRQQLAGVSGVLTHVSLVHGALSGIRSDVYGPGAMSPLGRRSFDRRA
jgi:hypothetical protein